MNDSGPVVPQAPRQDAPDQPEPVRQAVVKPSRWPGWIWAVPIAALVVVAWLGVRGIVRTGPTVTVTFATAPGVKPGQTNVQYEGLEVGTVESVTWHRDLQHVDVVLSMHADMDRHLGPGTRYWIAGQNFSLAHLSDIKDAIAGPHIELDPRPGKTVHHVAGSAEPPVVTAKQPGTTYVLHAEKLGSVGHGSLIYYLDMQVGKVEDTRLTDGGHGFDIVAVVHAPYDQLVHAGSRFWNAGAVQFATGGAGPSVRFQSVPALFEGAVAFETPTGPDAGPRAAKDARFTLYDSKDAAEHAAPPDGVEYLVQFDQTAGGLAANAPVKLLDDQIGVVRDAAVQYDAASRKLYTRATIVVDPSRIPTTPTTETADATPRARMDALLQSLIAQGLRAEIAETTPVIGGKMVALRFVPQAGDASLIPGPIPEIPSTSSSGVQDIVAQAGDVMHKLDAIPFEQIGENIRTATEHVAKLTRSPELTESLHHLDQSLTNIERITVQARERVGPILNQVHQVASEAESALASAKSVFASGAPGQNQPNTAGLPDTLYELARAARSLRELADYLDRHPEALLTGKGKNG